MRLTPGREALLVGLMVAALHALVRLRVAPGAFQDDAIYLALGKALADGDGWRSLYAAGAPVHLKYPPALPALYAVAWLAGGTAGRTVALVGALHLVTAGLIGGLLWWIARARLGLPTRTAALSLLPLGLVSVIDHLHIAIAEGPFLAAWLGAVALALGPLDRRRATVLGLMLGATVLLRSQGWAVLAGVLGGLLLDGRTRRATGLATAVALLPVVGWALWHRLMAAAGPVSSQLDEAGYLAWFGTVAAADLPATIARATWVNLASYARVIPRELLWGLTGYLLALTALALIVRGGMTGGRRLLPLTASLALSLALILVWPFTQERFVLALLPAASPLLALGAHALPGRVPRAGLLMLLILIGVVGLRQVSIRRAATVGDPMATIGFHPIGRTLTANTAWLETVGPWVATHTAPDARVLTEGAAGLWLATGRPGVAALPATPGVPPAGEAFDLDRYLRERLVADGVNWVVASSPPVMAAVAAAETRCPGTFRRGESIGQTAVAFAVRDSTAACLAGAR